MPNGNTAEWDYVEHRKGAAAVLPVLDNGNILMVKQYRSAVDCISLEIPGEAVIRLLNRQSNVRQGNSKRRRISLG